jgi:phage/plasmid-associated DNA primase
LEGQDIREVTLKFAIKPLSSQYLKGKGYNYEVVYRKRSHIFRDEDAAKRFVAKKEFKGDEM